MTTQHTVTLTCSKCDHAETFAADKRYLLVQMLDASLWRVDTFGEHTCYRCHGINQTYAECNAEQFMQQQRELRNRKRVA